MDVGLPGTIGPGGEEMVEVQRLSVSRRNPPMDHDVVAACEALHDDQCPSHVGVGVGRSQFLGGSATDHRSEPKHRQCV